MSVDKSICANHLNDGWVSRRGGGSGMRQAAIVTEEHCATAAETAGDA